MGTTKPKYEIEFLHSKVMLGNKTMYRVRWKGYPPNQDSWETRENLMREYSHLVQEYDLKCPKDDRRQPCKLTLKEMSSVPTSSSISSNAKSVSGSAEITESGSPSKTKSASSPSKAVVKDMSTRATGAKTPSNANANSDAPSTSSATGSRSATRNLRSSATTAKYKYEVESIESKTVMGTMTMYQVRWKGYPLQEDTWESKERLQYSNYNHLIEDYERTFLEQKPVVAPSSSPPKTANVKSSGGRSSGGTAVASDIAPAPKSKATPHSKSAAKDATARLAIIPTLTTKSATEGSDTGSNVSRSSGRHLRSSRSMRKIVVVQMQNDPVETIQVTHATPTVTEMKSKSNATKVAKVADSAGVRPVPGSLVGSPKRSSAKVTPSPVKVPPEKKEVLVPIVPNVVSAPLVPTISPNKLPASTAPPQQLPLSENSSTNSPSTAVSSSSDDANKWDAILVTIYNTIQYIREQKRRVDRENIAACLSKNKQTEKLSVLSVLEHLVKVGAFTEVAFRNQTSLRVNYNLANVSTVPSPPAAFLTSLKFPTSPCFKGSTRYLLKTSEKRFHDASGGGATSTASFSKSLLKTARKRTASFQTSAAQPLSKKLKFMKCNDALDTGGYKGFASRIVTVGLSPMKLSTIEKSLQNLPYCRISSGNTTSTTLPQPSTVVGTSSCSTSGTIPTASTASTLATTAEDNGSVESSVRTRAVMARQPENLYAKYQQIHVDREEDNSILIVTLLGEYKEAHPATKNALTATVLEEFSRVLRTASQDEQCRVVLVIGKGSVFSSGIDYSHLWRGGVPASVQAVQPVVPPTVTSTNVPATTTTTSVSTNNTSTCTSTNESQNKVLLPTTSPTPSHQTPSVWQRLFLQSSTIPQTNNSPHHNSNMDSLHSLGSSNSNPLLLGSNAVCGEHFASHAHHLANALCECALSVANFPKLLVGAVNGAAVGAAVGLLPLCDLVYAVERATFHLPYLTLGQLPEMGLSVSLHTLVGMHMSNELLLSGEKITARHALQRGLLSDVLPSQHFRYQVLERCRLLARRPANAVEMTKCLSRIHYKERIDMAIISECRRLAEIWGDPQFQCVAKSFLEEKLHQCL